MTIGGSFTADNNSLPWVTGNGHTPNTFTLPTTTTTAHPATRAASDKIKHGLYAHVAGGNVEVVRSVGTNAKVTPSLAHATVGARVGSVGRTPVV